MKEEIKTKINKRRQRGRDILSRTEIEIKVTPTKKLTK